jgi:hypothetical protein
MSDQHAGQALTLANGAQRGVSPMNWLCLLHFAFCSLLCGPFFILQAASGHRFCLLEIPKLDKNLQNAVTPIACGQSPVPASRLPKPAAGPVAFLPNKSKNLSER